jgi:hypothetical protein
MVRKYLVFATMVFSIFAGCASPSSREIDSACDKYLKMVQPMKIPPTQEEIQHKNYFRKWVEPRCPINGPPIRGVDVPQMMYRDT